ncbi:MAG: hypothetical protein KGJ35_02205 [Patescibacteria group bacterium]|nr:hypothetical protein [Patescibacteria group bacterium]
MMYSSSIQNFGISLHDVLVAIGYGVLNFIVPFIAAVLVFAIGWILAVLLERLIESIIKAIKLDSLLKSAGMEEIVKNAGYNLNSGRFIGALFKWFVIVVSFILALNIIGLPDVNYFLGDVVINYIPNVIIAILILIVAVIVADALQKLVVASVKAAHVKSAHLLGVITKWSIWIFALIAALIHLGIAAALIQTIVMGVVFAVALAVGLAFGLGSKDAAGRVTERVLHHITEKE